jgi:hypothetical protein
MKYALLFAFSLGSILTGCTKPCVELGEKICACEQTHSARESCREAVSAREEKINPSSEDNDRCEALIDKCDCTKLNTEEGKLNCGLAREESFQLE